MEITKHPSIANRSYEDYDPIIKWRREEGRDTLEVHLPGFKKEQVKVQLNHLGLMVISGERPLTEGNKWRRFKKEIEIPPNCNENSIYASFMQSILTVVMPKKVVIPKVDDDQEIEQQKIPELLSEPHHKDERDDNYYDETNYIHHKEFKGKGILKNYRKSIHYEAVRRDKEEEEEDGDVEEEEKEYEEFERRGSVELTPEATKEICFKILVVVIVVLIIASYVMEMFKSIVAESYFLN